MDDMVKDMQRRWGSCVVNQDAVGIMKLYDENAVLKPTLSARIRRHRDEIEAYFIGSSEFGDSGFLKNRFRDVRWLESAPRRVGDVVIDTGKYAFVKEDGDDVTADFTFVFIRGPAGLRILAQHSSLVFV